MIKSFAHVGAFKRFSIEDQNRTATAIIWLVQQAEPLTERCERDIVNLLYGRDFLKESKQYDAVILHSIFDPKGLAGTFLPKPLREASTSSLSSVDNWIKRLVATQARFIFVFEDQPMSINGWSLGDLPGYERVLIDHIWCVYRKEPI